jgi:hypothetical protein
VTRRRTTVPSADTAREIPAQSGARFDRIAAAAAALRDEERRLDRLGLADAADRCRRQLRYWEFLHALFTIAEPEGPRWSSGARGRTGTISCRTTPGR